VIVKFWRPGITGKLFLALFSPPASLLISMHWAVRISFERGFIDYIKRGNEQRLTMLSDALSEQYAQHGNWKFLRNNDRFIFQLLKSFERDNDDRFPAGAKQTPAARLTAWISAPDGPRRMVLRRTVHAAPARICPRTAGARMFWVVDQKGRVLVGPRERVPEDGTRAALWSTACRWARLSPRRSSV
jgi:two-component system sensor histidine kinase BaeS